MVLAELGSKLTGVLRKLQATTVVDEEILDSILKEICRALMEADVNVKLVGQKLGEGCCCFNMIYVTFEWIADFSRDDRFYFISIKNLRQYQKLC